jgi:hypothetical protein
MAFSPYIKEKAGQILGFIRDTPEKCTGTVEKNLVGWHQTKVCQTKVRCKP